MGYAAPMAHLSLRIDLAPDLRIDPGTIELLEQVESTGSISAACRAIGMSYSCAWLLIEDLNRRFAEPVVAARVGGSRGGGASLTEQGQELVACYRDLERQVQEVASHRLRTLLARQAMASPARKVEHPGSSP